MDIGQVSHLYRPSIGGIENYVYRLNNSIRAAGHNVTTYTTDLSLENEASPLETDADVHYGNTAVSILRNPLSIELYTQLRASTHDIYHLHNPWFLSSLEAACALPGDAPTIMTVHSTQIASTNPLIRGLDVAYQPLAQYVFNQVDHSFVQGKAEKQRLLGRFNVATEDVSVVPNGIHPEEYDVSEAEISRFRKRYSIDPQLPTVLFVSRLIPEKNPDVFIKSFTQYLGDHNLQALVVGTGKPEFVNKLKQIADDRIQFLSNLEFAALKASYHVADLFVFLGTWEGLPTVILEAMNGQLPIISTPVGAIADAVTDQENGILVSSPPDARAVATALRYYLEQPTVREEVGKRNRELVHKEYQWDGIADTMLERYNELVI